MVDAACGGQIGEIVPTVAPQILRLLFASRCVGEIRVNASWVVLTASFAKGGKMRLGVEEHAAYSRHDNASEPEEVL